MKKQKCNRCKKTMILMVQAKVLTYNAQYNFKWLCFNCLHQQSNLLTPEGIFDAAKAATTYEDIEGAK